ncbi:MAG: hypothetical protein ACR2MM_13705 [Flavobacteriaceae bacterium]
MKKILSHICLLLVAVLFYQCSSVKVLDAWRGEPESLEKFRSKNVLVFTRTADNSARIAFEEAIANQLESDGIKATESFKKFPKIHMNREMTAEREQMISSILDSEGYNGIVITTVKDKEQTTRTESSGVYMGAGYGSYYPGYYGGFYNYYRTPYAYGPYYNSFGGYIPTGSRTYTTTNYVLETVAYNLDEPEENQLVFVVTSSVDDPKDAYKTATKYVEKIVQAYDK